MILFEDTRICAVKPGVAINLLVCKELKIATAVVEYETTNAYSISSACAISLNLNIPYLTVWRALCSVLKYYPYKISQMDKLLSGDKEA